MMVRDMCVLQLRRASSGGVMLSVSRGV